MLWGCFLENWSSYPSPYPLFDSSLLFWLPLDVTSKAPWSSDVLKSSSMPTLVCTTNYLFLIISSSPNLYLLSFFPFHINDTHASISSITLKKFVDNFSNNSCVALCCLGIALATTTNPHFPTRTANGINTIWFLKSTDHSWSQISLIITIEYPRLYPSLISFSLLLRNKTWFASLTLNILTNLS